MSFRSVTLDQPPHLKFGYFITIVRKQTDRHRQIQKQNNLYYCLWIKKLSWRIYESLCHLFDCYMHTTFSLFLVYKLCVVHIDNNQCNKFYAVRCGQNFMTRIETTYFWKYTYIYILFLDVTELVENKMQKFGSRERSWELGPHYAYAAFVQSEFYL